MNNSEIFDKVETQGEQAQLSEIKHESSDLVTKANSMIIINSESYIDGANFLKVIKSAQKKVAEFCEPVIKKAHATWKEACEQRKKLDDPLSKAEALIKNKLIVYDAEQKRLAEQAQAKALEQAQKDKEKALKKAEELEKKGKSEQAETLRMQAESAPAPIIQKEVPKADGIVYKKNWEIEIIDESLIPREYLVPELSKIKKVANSLEGKVNIPGVRIYRKDIVSAKGA